MATSENKILNTAIADGMPVLLANYIVAQSKHETGNYTSNFFKFYNNAFGYSYAAGSKWQTGGGTLADNGSPIAKYKSVEDSVHELTDWIKRRQNEGKFPKNLNSINTPDKYVILLKQSGYYGDTITNYLKGVLSFLKHLSGDSSASLITIIVILVLVSLLFIK